jgi:uncharacterized protein (TIGR01244 family)
VLVFYKTRIALLLLLLAATAATAPGTVRADHHGAAHVDSTAQAGASLLLPITNARIPMPGLLTGGQPTEEQIEAAARAGYRTVINMRGSGESGFDWEPEMVEKLGMKYEQLPVTGKDSLTRERIAQIDAVLDAALADGPVLLHCASGNRIGAVLALRAAWVEGMDPEQALAYGRASGMTRTEGLTRELLGLPESK